MAEPTKLQPRFIYLDLDTLNDKTFKEGFPDVLSVKLKDGGGLSADGGIYIDPAWLSDHLDSELGTMAYQNANSVSITGGSINGATIGLTNPSDAKFIDLETLGDLTVNGNFTVNGDMVELNVERWIVEDKNIEIGNISSETENLLVSCPPSMAVDFSGSYILAGTLHGKPYYVHSENEDYILAWTNAWLSSKWTEEWGWGFIDRSNNPLWPETTRQDYLVVKDAGFTGGTYGPNPEFNGIYYEMGQYRGRPYYILNADTESESVKAIFYRDSNQSSPGQGWFLTTLTRGEVEEYLETGILITIHPDAYNGWGDPHDGPYPWSENPDPFYFNGLDNTMGVNNVGEVGNGLGLIGWTHRPTPPFHPNNYMSFNDTDTPDLAVGFVNLDIIIETISGDGQPTDITADGGGITLLGTTDKEIKWVRSTQAWTFNQHIDIIGNNGLKVGGDEVIDSNKNWVGNPIGINKLNISPSDLNLKTLTFGKGLGSGTYNGTADITLEVDEGWLQGFIEENVIIPEPDIHNPLTLTPNGSDDYLQLDESSQTLTAKVIGYRHTDFADQDLKKVSNPRFYGVRLEDGAGTSTAIDPHGLYLYAHNPSPILSVTHNLGVRYSSYERINIISWGDQTVANIRWNHQSKTLKFSVDDYDEEDNEIEPRINIDARWAGEVIDISYLPTLSGLTLPNQKIVVGDTLIEAIDKLQGQIDGVHNPLTLISINDNDPDNPFDYLQLDESNQTLTAKVIGYRHTDFADQSLKTTDIPGFQGIDLIDGDNIFNTLRHGSLTLWASISDPFFRVTRDTGILLNSVGADSGKNPLLTWGFDDYRIIEWDHGDNVLRFFHNDLANNETTPLTIDAIWGGEVIPVSKGGTGLTNINGGEILIGVFDGGLGHNRLEPRGLEGDDNINVVIGSDNVGFTLKSILNIEGIDIKSTGNTANQVLRGDSLSLYLDDADIPFVSLSRHGGLSFHSAFYGNQITVMSWGQAINSHEITWDILDEWDNSKNVLRFWNADQEHRINIDARWAGEVIGISYLPTLRDLEFPNEKIAADDTYIEAADKLQGQIDNIRETIVDIITDGVNIVSYTQHAEITANQTVPTYFALDYPPVEGLNAKIAMSMKHAPGLHQDDDFELIVSGSEYRISWANLGLDGIVRDQDKFTVTYLANVAGD